MAGSALKVTDRGYSRIKRQMHTAQNRIKVGVQSASGDELVLVATFNEFGTETAPQRSYIRAAIDEHREEIKAYSKKLYADFIDKGGDIDRYLGLLGTFTQALIQKKVHSNIPPPNSAATVARKGSSHTLIDTGHLVQSIRWAIAKPGAEGIA